MYGRMRKQDALLYIQDVTLLSGMYVEEFPCLQSNKRPLLHNCIVNIVDFEAGEKFAGLKMYVATKCCNKSRAIP